MKTVEQRRQHIEGVEIGSFLSRYIVEWMVDAMIDEPTDNVGDAISGAFVSWRLYVQNTDVEAARPHDTVNMLKVLCIL